MSIYTDNGYRNRVEYLHSLADDYGVSFDDVANLARALGPDEDFDALVTEVEDLAEMQDGMEESSNELKYYLRNYLFVVVTGYLDDLPDCTIMGFRREDRAIEEVLIDLTRYDSEETHLFDTFKKTDTTYDFTRIDKRYLAKSENPDRDWDYTLTDYINPNIVGSRNARRNKEEILRMAEVETVPFTF